MKLQYFLSLGLLLSCNTLIHSIDPDKNETTIEQIRTKKPRVKKEVEATEVTEEVQKELSLGALFCGTVSTVSGVGALAAAILNLQTVNALELNHQTAKNYTRIIGTSVGLLYVAHHALCKAYKNFNNV